MSLPLRLHRDGCKCRKCLAARAQVSLIEEKLYVLAQLGRVGVISPQELTGGEKVMHAGSKA